VDYPDSRLIRSMTDTRTPDVRRRIMQAVRTQDTGPEMVVRRLLHGLGYRYRLHRKSLPGSPDLVFPKRRKVVFVNGCYWHGHGCAKGRLPKSRVEYWAPKIEKNKDRDRASLAALKRLGWKACSIWQCETRDPNALQKRLMRFLGEPTNSDRFFPTRAIRSSIRAR
jgi:DNA mismatch endonuclease (patch repair protein)